MLNYVLLLLFSLAFPTFDVNVHTCFCISLIRAQTSGWQIQQSTFLRRAAVQTFLGFISLGGQVVRNEDDQGKKVGIEVVSGK
jgi:hypothetical protein